MSERNPRIAGYQRLRDLPAVFKLDDVERVTGLDRPTSKVACLRWKAAEMVSPLAARGVGVYFNLVVDPSGPTTRRQDAVDKALRRPAIVVGGKALHAHGWTTQQHRILHLAVPQAHAARSLPTLDHGIQLLGRSMKWFNVVARGAEIGVESFKVARPAAALADALLSRSKRGINDTSSWCPDPDDIEIDDPDGLDETRSVLALLGANDDLADQLLEGFRVDAVSSMTL